MDKSEFRKHAHELADWMADYLESVETFPVRSQLAPGEVRRSLPDHPPKQGDPSIRLWLIWTMWLCLA